MSANGPPDYKWTYLGLGADSGYGPWRYQVFPSQEELVKKFCLFANVEKDATARVTSVAFQPCLDEDSRSQDRRVAQSWNLRNGRWTFVGVFDGHAGHETVDYAMTNLPLKVKSKLEALLEETEGATEPPSSDMVSSLLGDTISDFDDSLLEDLLALFPGGFEGALKLSSEEVEDIINDADRGGHNIKKVHRCMRGSTALISLLDPPGENLWVANLGDCEAVLGTKSPDGTWKATSLSSNHNGDNDAEVKRVRDEHPGENECILRDRVLGAIAVTRALGDYVFKLPAIFTTSVFARAQPGFSFRVGRLDDWLPRNITPPYLSNRPDVRHCRLDGEKDEDGDAPPGAFLILCSDGLTAVYPKERNDVTNWVQVVGSAVDSGVSPALALLWEALGGDADTVSQYMTLESTEIWMDDTTISVLTL
ncbi:protein serine threonine phosphatase 2C [Gautieria morchelliformis]|nr:protein serine threonine phosphatase 2C [Gautieria morchelliformis]